MSQTLPPEARNLETPSHPGFMPPGADLAAILARTTPAEAYILLALIANAEPTGQAGRLTTDRTTAELAEAVGMSRDTVDRALNGDPSRKPRGGLTTAGLVTDAGNRGRRLIREINLPMHGQTPTATSNKTPTSLHNIYSAATMPRHSDGKLAALHPNGAAIPPRGQKPSAAPMPDHQADARQNRRAAPPAFKSPGFDHPEKDKQQQQGRAAGRATSAPEVVNTSADTDAAREALTPELAQPVAERLAHIVPLAVVRAAIARANIQAKGRGFRTSRRDFVYRLLTSADFHAETLADAQAAATRAAAVTARTKATQATRQKQAAAAIDEAAQAQADRERETADLNQIIEDMPDERIAAIVAEIVAADPAWRLAARAAGGIRAAVRRTGLRGAFIARVRLIEAKEPRTVEAIE